ncbi:MAG: ribosome-associated translation inhibitor RaiA [Desulfobacterales bacterium]|jgi:putative sigma-54 modulation protein|nr:ribosome-associated translation inhibitor RaiA [Desulfobacteraceae bacterium]MDD3990632.1 ribosome-associated translation inhibitor RaiA [Desulfobacteraceae bacterium]MDY0311521.1 ribosome-associated translation inhibitor RaiA [Desulfobacterales bacterium]
MQVALTFKNLDASEHFKQYVQEKLDRVDKLLDKPASAEVVLGTENLHQVAEVRLASGGLSVQAKADADDLHAAIDQMVDRVRRQITKQKEKVRERRPAVPLAN